MNAIEKTGVAQIKKFFSCLKNGNVKRNNAIARIKKIEPPQADIDNVRNNAAPISFKAEILFLLFFIPDTNRYNAKNPKKSPSGSDLNQPAKPRTRTGIEIANIKEANNPAVVPPSTLTNAKATTEVKEPITSGNSIVKLYNDAPKLKIGYRIAVVKCRVT